MTALLAKLTDLLAKIDDLLSGEPARFIGYGAAIVIVGVVALANALGFTRLGADISLTDALTLAGVAIAFIVPAIETIRHFVTPLVAPTLAVGTPVLVAGTGDTPPADAVVTLKADATPVVPGG